MRFSENEKAVPFSIEWRTFNSRNKMGGKLMTAENAILCFKIPKTNASKNLSNIEKVKKNPNHWENRTRNIELSTGEIVKVNIDLITRFNNKEVIF